MFRILNGILGLLLIPTFSFGQVRWVGTLDGAIDRASAEGKFIVLDVSADWCPPCQRMERDVYPHPDFIAFSEKQVFMLLDAYKEPEGIRLARKYNVKVFPTILVLDSKGTEIDRLTGGRGAQALIDDLNRIFEDPIPFRALNEKAESDRDDFQLQYLAGQRAVERDDFQRGRTFLRRAIELSEGRELETRVDVLIDHALASFEGGAYEECLQSLDQLQKIDTRIADMPVLKGQRARALMALKRYDEGAKLINEILRSDSQEQRDEAKQLLSKLPSDYRKQDKKVAELTQKAEKNLEKGKLQEALRQANEAVELDPESAEGHAVLARIHYQAGQSVNEAAEKNRHYTTALEELRLARLIDPESILIYGCAKELLAYRLAPSHPASKEGREKYVKAEEFFSSARYREAAELYLEVMKIEPQFGKAYLHLGDCFFQNGQMDQALRLYQEAIRRTPLDAAAHRFAADALSKLNRAEEAGQALLNSLMADPEYPLVWNDLKILAQQQQRAFERHSRLIPRALRLQRGEDYELLLKDVPQGTAPAWREYLNQKFIWRQQRFAQEFPNQPFYVHTAREETDCLTQLVGRWRQIKEEDPSLQDKDLDFLEQLSVDGQLDAFVFLELFSEEYRNEFETWKQTNRERALSYLDEYIFGAAQARSGGEFNSSAIQAFNAGVNVHQANPDEAIGFYLKALAQEPRMVPALSNLTMLYLQKHNYDEAEELLQRWIDLQPESAQPLEMLSMVHFHRQQFDKAIELLESAMKLEKDPENKKRYESNLEAFRTHLRDKK